jgi:NTE family protein
VSRRGLVLGGGGTLGLAWSIGALEAVEEAGGRGEFEMIVGTSAGAITAALLGCGVSIAAMVRHQQGVPAEGDPLIPFSEETETAAPRPPWPAFGVGSPGLLARAARHPRSVTPLAALSAFLPRGRGSLEPVRSLIATLTVDAEKESGSRSSLWIVAMDYESGRRVVFGAPEAPPAPLADAVVASCTIPGWFPPVTIGTRSYVDGGTCSATSLDLLADQGLDEVVVVAPMASLDYDRPSSLTARVERRVRRAITRRLLREADLVRAGGTKVTLLTPGPDDLAALGSNLMDPARRREVLEVSRRTCREILSAESGDGAAPVKAVTSSGSMQHRTRGAASVVHEQ